MQTYTYVSKGKFELMEKPKPVLMHERDAIVKVTLASICSSDLHIKHGSVPRALPGITVGHGFEIISIKNMKKEDYHIRQEQTSIKRSAFFWSFGR